MLANILRFFASDALAKGIAVLFIPVFSYILGPTQLGLFSEWFALFNVFAALVALGVPSFVLVLLSRDGEQFEVINQKVLTFLAQWCVLLGALNLIYLYLAPNLLYGLGLYFAAVFFVVINYAAAVLRHQQRFTRYLKLQLALTCGTSVVPALCVIYSANWEARALGYLFGLLLLACLVYLISGRQFRIAKLTRAFRFEALSFGSSIAMMSGLAWFKLGADIQFLKLASGYSSSGILFFSFQIVSIVSIIAASLNRSSAPTFYKLIHESRQREFSGLINRLMVGLSLLAIVTVALAFLLVSYGLPEFQEAMFLIYPMALGAVVYGAGQFFASVYLYCKKPFMLTWCIGISSVFHPVVSYLVVFQLGWEWVGWSYLASSILFLLLVCMNLFRVRNVWKLEL